MAWDWEFEMWCVGIVDLPVSYVHRSCGQDRCCFRKVYSVDPFCQFFLLLLFGWLHGNLWALFFIFLLKNVASSNLVLRLTDVSGHYTWKGWQCLIPFVEKLLLWRSSCGMVISIPCHSALCWLFALWAESASPEASLDGCPDPYCFISKRGCWVSHGEVSGYLVRG